MPYFEDLSKYGTVESTAEEEDSLDDFIEDIEHEADDLISDLESLDDPEAESIKEKAKLAAEASLKKISEALGSNPGGWYLEQETGNKFYIKFYENADRARIEHLTNLIYKKLGISVAETKLLIIDGKLAIASSEIEDAQGTTLGEQCSDKLLRKGFVADAYLANWDVVGLCFDNIVKSDEGEMVRIDNGGSMIFRAQGGKKEFSPSDIPELENMLNPDYPAGKVFAGLSQEEMKRQAQRLINRLREDDIERLAGEVDLSGELKEELVEALKGRRKFLIEKFDLKESQDPAKRVPVAVERVREMAEKFKDFEMYPRVSFLADSDKIENQEIDVITQDNGEIHLFFKLTAAHYWKVRSKFVHSGTARDLTTIQYKGNGQTFTLAQAYSQAFGEISVELVDRPGQRCALGLVRIRVTGDTAELKLDEIGKRMNDLLVTHLEIPDGLSLPDAEAEVAYKRARYAWHHKLDGVPEGIEDKLTREEVFPEYYTMVEKGKHKEYQAQSHYAVYHQLYSIENIVKIIKAGGLLSTHERFRRGLIVSGMSSHQDMETGGGDSVFTRTITEAVVDAKSTSYGSEMLPSSDTVIIFRPELFDRTDWYAYARDNYGKTEEEYFNQRQSPEELFQHQCKGKYDSGNEQMFRLGISCKDFMGIALRTEKELIDLYIKLENEKITEINGKPIADFIFLTKKMRDYITISEGRGDEVKSFARLIAEDENFSERVEMERLGNLKELPHRLESYSKNLSECLRDGYVRDFRSYLIDLNGFNLQYFLNDYQIKMGVSEMPAIVKKRSIKALNEIKQLIQSAIDNSSFRFKDFYDLDYMEDNERLLDNCKKANTKIENLLGLFQTESNESTK